MEELPTKLSGSPFTEETASTLRLLRLQKSPLISSEARNAVRAVLENAAILQEATVGLPEVVAPEASPKDVGQQLRRLIQSNAPWESIANLLKPALIKSRSPSDAARLLELAFVQASPLEALEALDYVMGRKIQGFYGLLHPKLRDFIVQNCNVEYAHQIYQAIHNAKPPIEKTAHETLFSFLHLTTAKDKTAAWIYYCANKDRILTCHGPASSSQLSKDQLYQRVGNLALSLGYDEEARSLFSKLGVNSPERDAALADILRYESAIMEKGRHKYLTNLEALNSWADRLECIDEYCRAARRKNEFSDYNRPALNNIFKGLIDWVPPLPEAWKASADLVLRNRDLARILPNLLSLFEDNALKFQSLDFENSIWSALSLIDAKDSDETHLKAVALMHLYGARLDHQERELWSARDLFQKLAATLPNNDKGFWRDIIAATQAYVETSRVHTMAAKQRKIACLRIALHGAKSSDLIIDHYLEFVESPSAIFVEELAMQAWEQGNTLAFLKIVSRYSSVSNLSTKLLNNTWQAAITIDNHDLAWRVATIAASRKQLTSNLSQTWEISGEKRTAYSPCKLLPHELEIALDGLSDPVRSVLHALVILGTKLCHLAEITKRSGFVTRPITAPKGAVQENIHNALKLSGLSVPGKSVTDQLGNRPLNGEIVSLVHDVDDNSWTYAVRTILERLSASCWRYSFDSLRDLTCEGMPASGFLSKMKSSTQVGAWLGKLTPHERAAWGDLKQTLTENQSIHFEVWLAKFSVRLATLIYPSHFLALSSLQDAHASLELINDLEAFLLSPKYSAFRHSRGIYSRVRVADSLKSSPIIQQL